MKKKPFYSSNRAVPLVRKKFEKWFRQLRKERGLSQEALGRRAGLSSKFIGEVERGDKSISLDNLWRIARCGFGISLKRLMDF